MPDPARTVRRSLLVMRLFGMSRRRALLRVAGICQTIRLSAPMIGRHDLTWLDRVGDEAVTWLRREYRSLYPDQGGQQEHARSKPAGSRSAA